MKYEPALLDPVKLVHDEAAKIIEYELDVAAELYLIKQCGAIFYKDLMSSVPKDLASKTRLVTWLNDRSGKKGKYPGIITLYKAQYKHHFKTGTWMARNFGVYMKFASAKLTDPKYVGKKNALLFRKSLSDFRWFHQAITVCGLKLLETNHKQNTLKSRVVAAYLDIAFATRDELNSIGAIIGRSTKNHNATIMKDELYAIIEQAYRDKYQKFIIANHDNREHALLEKWSPEIEALIGYLSNNPLFLEPVQLFPAIQGG